MASADNKLKEEIIAELRQDLNRGGGAMQVINMVMLVLIGLVIGFAVGQRFERKRQAVMDRPGLAARAAAQRNPNGELPPDHPPINAAEGGEVDMMALVQTLQGRLEEDPDDLEALIQLGNLNFQIERMETAIEYYQRALALDPGNPNVITDMGIANRRLGRFDEALDAFELAASLDETHWQSRLNRGVVLMMDKGDLHGAIDAFEDFLAMGPDVPNRDAVERQLEQLRQEDAAHGHGDTDASATDADA